MTADELFSLLNLVTMSVWLTLICLPRVRWAATVLPLTVAAILAVIYVALLVASLPWAGGGFSSLEAVSALFENRRALLAGWTHYLAFDLFIGAWEVRDSQQRQIPHLLVVPPLVLTFFFGPAGLLLYLGIRRFAGNEPRSLTP